MDENNITIHCSSILNICLTSTITINPYIHKYFSLIFISKKYTPIAQCIGSIRTHCHNPSTVRTLHMGRMKYPQIISTPIGGHRKVNIIPYLNFCGIMSTIKAIVSSLSKSTYLTHSHKNFSIYFIVPKTISFPMRANNPIRLPALQRVRILPKQTKLLHYIKLLLILMFLI